MLGALIATGLATAGNAVILIQKAREHRFTELLIDLGFTATFSALFAGTLGGMAIAMIASITLSIWLYFNPITIDINPDRETIIYGVLALIGIALITFIANIYWVEAYALLNEYITMRV